MRRSLLDDLSYCITLKKILVQSPGAHPPRRSPRLTNRVLLDRKEVHVKQQSQGFSPLSSSFATCSVFFWHSPSLLNRCGNQEVETRGTKRNGTVHRPMSHGEMEGTAGLVQKYPAAWVHDDVSAYVNSQIMLHRVSIL